MKILMLGWEFPPLFSGGLGIATYGIVKSLSQKVDIRLIIPSSNNDNLLHNVTITGLNQLQNSDIELDKLQFNLEKYAAVEKIPMTISPYHHVNHEIEKEEQILLGQKLNAGSYLPRIHEIFSSKEVYGRNILQKVYLFACLVEELGLQSPFDVVHCHDWITYPAGIRIKKKTNKPLVLHVHALETDRSGSETRNEIYQLEKEGLDMADKIVAVSNYTKNQIVKHYGINPNKIEVVHNGIEPDSVKRSNHELKDKLVVFLGRLTGQKGPQFLVETAEKVTRVFPNVKFVVAGTGDQFTPLLEHTANKRLGRKFIFTGFLSKAKVNQLLSMADVYFMPSVSEPFGLTALEAAQYDVPTVLSAQSGAAEVMKGSLQADFWDTSKYANYIFALLKYQSLGKSLTAQAQKEINTLTWGHAADRLLSIYQSFN